MIFKKQAEDEFKIKSVVSPEMDRELKCCAGIYAGKPPWLSKDNRIRTVNFAKSICSETARLTTLAIGIQIEGSARANWLQEQIDKVYFQVRHWVEFGCAYGTLFVKPNGEGLDIFTPEDVILVDYDNQGIKGMVFRDTYTKGDKFYTRLEYHRFAEMQQGGEKV